jgi:hypothetical protein
MSTRDRGSWDWERTPAEPPHHFAGNPFERYRVYTGYALRRAQWYIERNGVRTYYSTRREALDAAKALVVPA